jgi:hypothetical protein
VAHPDRPPLNDPDVQALIAQVAPGARATDLGGVMSLNASLEPSGLVLRFRLGNACLTPDGETLYLDFGFLARRPRIHELGYSLAFMVLALEGHEAPERFDWESVPRMVAVYEGAAGFHLDELERKALAPSTAAVPLYHAAIAGFTADPARQLRKSLPFLRLSEWLLEGCPGRL